MPMQGFAYNSIFLERSIDTDLMCYIGKKNKKKVTSLKKYPYLCCVECDKKMLAKCRNNSHSTRYYQTTTEY